MCHYFNSLYQCGHQRLEVVECAPVQSRRSEGSRYNHATQLRCRPPQQVLPSYVQPCGCLHAQVLSTLFWKTRRLPAHMSRNRAEPKRLMSQIWGVEHTDEIEALGDLARRRLAAEAGELLRREKPAGYCLAPVPQGARISQDPVNVARWREEEQEALKEERAEAKDSEEREGYIVVGDRLLDGGEGRKRRYDDDDDDYEVVSKRARRDSDTLREEGRLTPFGCEQDE